MICFGYPNDRFHHIWKAAATTTALVKPVVNFRRDDQLPSILVKQFKNRCFDLFFSDEVAVTNQHDLLWWLTGHAAPRLASGFFLLEHLVGRIQAVRTLECDSLELK